MESCQRVMLHYALHDIEIEHGDQDSVAGIAILGTVFAWAFLSFWSAIPAGIALQAAPAAVALTVTVSYGAGAVLVVAAGTPLRRRIAQRMERGAKPGKPNRMVTAVQTAWNRFGLAGLALLAPVTVGAQIGAVIGLSLGARPLRLVIAMTLGAALWSILITLAVVGGLLAVTR